MKDKKSTSGAGFRGFAKLSIGTIISRITGMLREMSLAYFLGSGAKMDAYFIAYDLTNLFRHVLGEKVTESAILPVYKKTLSGMGVPYTNLLIRKLLFILVTVSTLVTVIGIIFSPWIVSVFAPGFSDETEILAIKMTRIMFPFLIFISTASFFGALLLAHNKFSLYSLAPVLFNIAMVVFLWLGVSRWGEYAAAAGVLFGGFLEMMIMLPFLPEHLSEKREIFKGKQRELKQVWHLMIPIFFDTVLEKTVVFFDRMLASYLIAGSISALGYAFRLLQLPYGVFVLAIARNFYSAMVDASDNATEFIRCVGSALRFVFTILMPCAVIMAVLREPIIRIVYRRGAFDEEALKMTSLAFACYGIGLLGMGMQSIMTRSFNALLDTKTPLYVSIQLMITNIILNLLLVRTPLKHGGLALATSIAYTLSGMMLFYLLRKKLSKRFQQKIFFKVLPTVQKVLIASVISGVSGWVLIYFWGNSSTLMNAVYRLTVGIIVCVLMYAGVLKCMKFRLSDLIFRRSGSVENAQ